MPELPEVESLRRHLVKQGLVGQTITGVTIARPATIQEPDPATFSKGVVGRRIEAFDRRGKYMLLQLDRGTLIVHLRMTGKLELLPPAHPSFSGKGRAVTGAGLGPTPLDARTRVSFVLDSGKGGLRFTDWRSLGKMWLVDDPQTVVGKLGPEPLDDGFTPAYVRKALDRPRAIKPLLLDQTAFAGVGNLYADEVLWHSKVHPERLANSLSVREAGLVHLWTRDLLSAAADILERALDEGGEFEAENGRGARKVDSEGLSQEVFVLVRGKGGLCPRCGTAIAGIRVGGRGTYFCPNCQKLKSASRRTPRPA